METTELIKTIPQGSLLWPKEPFMAKVGRATIKAFPGQSFWVTSTAQAQVTTGTVEIARSGKPMGSGWAFTLQDAHKFFRL